MPDPAPANPPAHASSPWPLRAHWALALGIAILWFLLALLLDKPTYDILKHIPYKESDFLRLLRVMGILHTWAFVAMVFLLIDRIRRKADGPNAVFFRASFLFASTVAAGVLGELAKLLIRRERPELHDGQYGFRPFSENLLSTSNLGMPSTHAIVAFAAAWALYRLHPAGWPIYFFFAVGCASTRLMDHAHFLSDVCLAAIMSYFVVRTLNLAWVDPGHSIPLTNTTATQETT